MRRPWVRSSDAKSAPMHFLFLNFSLHFCRKQLFLFLIHAKKNYVDSSSTFLRNFRSKVQLRSAKETSSLAWFYWTYGHNQNLDPVSQNYKCKCSHKQESNRPIKDLKFRFKCHLVRCLKTGLTWVQLRFGRTHRKFPPLNHCLIFKLPLINKHLTDLGHLQIWEEAWLKFARLNNSL